MATIALIFPTNQKDGLHILLMKLFSSGIQTPESFREKKGDATTALSPFLRMNVLLLHAWMKDTYKTDCAPYLSTYNQLCTIYNQIATNVNALNQFSSTNIYYSAYKFGIIETGYYVFEIFAINNQLLLLTAACGNDPAAPNLDPSGLPSSELFCPPSAPSPSSPPRLASWPPPSPVVRSPPPLR